MNKLRTKLFKKLSQATEPVPSAPAPAALPQPPNFQASALYPGIRNGFNPLSINLIDQLINILNIALHYSSNGKVNFQTLRNQSFNVDASIAPSVDQKNLTNLSKKVYLILLNNGAVFISQLSAAQVHNMIDQLVNSQEINNLSSINPSGPIAQKVPGNIKTNIINLLNQIKSVYPV